MKNRTIIHSFLGLMVMAAFLFTGCTESDVEKARDAYDWNKVIPKILDFQGPTEVSASGLAAVKYSVAYRGGSTYNWTTAGYEADIKQDSIYPNVVYVTWHQSSVDTSAYLIVTETTHGGVTSEPDSLHVILKRFCPWSIDDFVGTWKGSETGDSKVDDLTVTVVHNAEDGDNVIRVKAVPDGDVFHPPFLSKVYEGWGETFQKGHGNEGDVLLHIGLLDGSITIEHDYWGQTLPGPYDYWTGGGGTWSGCTGMMNIDFYMYWSQNFSKPNRKSHVEIKKQ